MTDLTDHRPKEIKEVVSQVDGDEANESKEVLTMISGIYTPETYANRILKSVRIVGQVASQLRHSKVSPENIARKWNIGLDHAKDTLRVTTQKGI
jgi:hypothetical protein